MDLPKNTQTWVFNDPLPCILYQQGCRLQDATASGIPGSQGGQEALLLPLRSFQPGSFSPSLWFCSTQLSRNISVWVFTGSRGVRQVLGRGCPGDIPAVTKASCPGRSLLGHTSVDPKKGFCPTALLAGIRDLHMKGKLEKGSTRALSNSLKISLGDWRRAASQAQLSTQEQPLLCSSWPQEQALGHPRHLSLSPVNIQGISRHGNSHCPDQTVSLAGNREGRTQNSTKMQLLRLKL